MRLAVFAEADSFSSLRVSSTLAAATSGFGRSPFFAFTYFHELVEVVCSEASTHAKEQGDEKVVKPTQHDPKYQKNTTKNMPSLQLLLSHLAGN